jgi:hypothetical protein
MQTGLGPTHRQQPFTTTELQGQNPTCSKTKPTMCRVPTRIKSCASTQQRLSLLTWTSFGGLHQATLIFTQSMSRLPFCQLSVLRQQDIQCRAPSLSNLNPFAIPYKSSHPLSRPSHMKFGNPEKM